jgi:hypothetical protein
MSTIDTTSQTTYAVAPTATYAVQPTVTYAPNPYGVTAATVYPAYPGAVVAPTTVRARASGALLRLCLCD